MRDLRFLSSKLWYGTDLGLFFMYLAIVRFT